jgi:group I intron endonuclease
VGQTCKDVAERWGEHLRHSRRGTFKPLYNSIRKHGEESFSVKRIATAVDNELADIAEKFFIKMYQSNNLEKGYNLTAGGEGNHGWCPSEETRNKISTTLTGRKNGPHSLETKQKIGDAQRGKKVSPEHLANMIISRNSPEVQEKHRIAHTGIKHTDETKAKLSAAHKGKILSDEHKAKISASLLKRKNNEMGV